jgi:WD40 repeat protein
MKRIISSLVAASAFALASVSWLLMCHGEPINDIITIAPISRETLLLTAQFNGQVAFRSYPSLITRPSFLPVCPMLMAATVSSSERYCAIGHSGSRVDLWDIAGEARRWTAVHPDICAIAFHPDERAVYTAGLDKKVRCWRTSDGQKLFELDVFSSDVGSIVFSSSGDELFIASYLGELFRFELPGLSATRVELGERPITALAYVPSRVARPAELAVGTADGAILICDARTLRVCRTVGPHPFDVDQLTCSRHGDYLVSSSRITATGSSGSCDLRLWNLQDDDKCVHIENRHAYRVHAIAILEHHSQIVTGDSIGKIEIHDLPPVNE